MKQQVHIFDFDGTLTRKDTFIEIIRYVRGGRMLLWGLLRYSPLLIGMKLGLYPNWKAKQRVFSYFFKGMTETEFRQWCERFAADRATLLRPAAIQALSRVQALGLRTLVVSASIDWWVMPFLTGMPSVEVLGTRLEVTDGLLTGHFLTANCYGAEKVRRVRQVLTLPRSSYDITAYGDSRGDKELLDYADQGYYKPFR